jgi:sugar phosphate isomerase/epimerase
MIRPGLVSITFRKSSPEEIIRMCLDAGLVGIEWGGDVHVPHGQVDVAERVGRLTRDSGCEVACYGSYYRCGFSEEEGLSFDAVLESALALGAPSIRVWIGKRGSAETDDVLRRKVIEDLRRICLLAGEAGVQIRGEKHGGTLTDDDQSLALVLKELEGTGFQMLWQPFPAWTVAKNMESLRLVQPILGHLHVFHWVGAKNERRVLAEGRDEWAQYLGEVALREKDCWALLEFVRGDEPSQLVPDAQSLHEWLRSVQAIGN